jgi:hypothetical protein
MESRRALNRETLYAASKELEHAAKNRGKPPKKERKAAAEEAEVDDKVLEEAAAHAKTKADKKKRKSSESDPSSNGTEAAAGEPSSHEKEEPSKKVKKSKAAAVAAPEPAPAAAEQPPSTSSDRKNKKKHHKKAELDEADAGNVTPIVSPSSAAGALEAADARRRKSVRFSLKRNLVMTIGQPPLPEDIRTPPTSKPKGSALKVKTNMHRYVGSALGKPAAAKRRLSVNVPASAPPKCNIINGSGAHGKGRSPVGTRSVGKAKGPAGNGRRNSGGGSGVSGSKRPRASDFF